MARQGELDSEIAAFLHPAHLYSQEGGSRQALAGPGQPRCAWLVVPWLRIAQPAPSAAEPDPLAELPCGMGDAPGQQDLSQLPVACPICH